MHYSKAPIIEALISIQIQPLPNDYLWKFETISDLVGYGKPTKIKNFNVQGNFQNESEPHSSASQEEVGCFFRHANQQHSLQARLDSFTFSRLAPYGDWTQFRTEGRRLWESYKQVSGPIEVTGYGVRFINKISLPAGEEIAHYLRTYAEVSPDLPQTLSSQFMRLELQIPESVGVLVVQQFFAPQEVPGLVPVILDLELNFRETISTDKALWEKVDALRERKNQYFRGCLTDKMEERLL